MQTDFTFSRYTLQSLSVSELSQGTIALTCFLYMPKKCKTWIHSHHADSSFIWRLMLKNAQLLQVQRMRGSYPRSRYTKMVIEWRRLFAQVGRCWNIQWGIIAYRAHLESFGLPLCHFCLVVICCPWRELPPSQFLPPSICTNLHFSQPVRIEQIPVT